MLEFSLIGAWLGQTSNIMRRETFHADDLVRLLRQRTIATMPELKKALGTAVDVTVFRKLKQIDYRTSYSHRGSYYALEELVRFDEKGLWSFDSVWFSSHGTLLATAEAFVEHSQAGYFVEELDELLHVETKDPLLRLIAQRRIARELVSGLYLYGSIDPAMRKRQLEARHERQRTPAGASGLAIDQANEEMKAAMVLFLSMLDEKQRRIYAGLESLKLGYGGNQRIADFIGMDPHTVAKGRRELEERDVDIERIRKAGGGRKPTEKKRPKSSPTSKN